eukprot:12920988-Alexandrium_andersonii.AAC.1
MAAYELMPGMRPVGDPTGGFVLEAVTTRLARVLEDGRQVTVAAPMGRAVAGVGFCVVHGGGT